MENSERGLLIAIIVIMVIAFCIAYMHYFIECSSMNVSEMPGYCVYLLSHK